MTALVIRKFREGTNFMLMYFAYILFYLEDTHFCLPLDDIMKY